MKTEENTDIACTIVTADHLHFALALHQSLQQHGKAELYVLVVDEALEQNLEARLKGVHILYCAEILSTPLGGEVMSKYGSGDPDILRWSLKPIFIAHLLECHGKVIFLDCDIFFFNNYQFLWDALDNCNLLLSPHWRNIDVGHPDPIEQLHFQKLFIEGIYNAGFVGATKKALPAVNWWAKACLDRCIKLPGEGLYVDQTYLNILPVYFAGVQAIDHKGCNVAEWNYVLCKRTAELDGTITINHQYPIVFIHFTSYLRQDIIIGRDKLLKPLMDKWDVSINQFKIFLNTKTKVAEILAPEANSFVEDGLVKNVKFKFSIRSRIRKFLQG